jgi:hypothetical protein
LPRDPTGSDGKVGAALADRSTEPGVGTAPTNQPGRTPFMAKRPRVVSAVVVLALVTGSLVTVAQLSTAKPAGATLPGISMPLQEFVADGGGGRPWNNYNQTANSAGPAMAGRPSPIGYGPTVHVYARAATGDLYEFINDGFGGRLWNAYDLTAITRSTTISGDPNAVFFGAIVHVYAEAPNGDLIEFVNDGAGGRLWNAYDLTAITGGPTLGGDPAAMVNGTSDRVFARASDGTLVEYTNDGVGGHLWNAYDLTTESGGDALGGDPYPLLVGSTVHVFAQNGNGDLVDFVNNSAGGKPWNEVDLTATTNGAPSVTGRPSALISNGLVNVFARASSGALTDFVGSGAAGSSWSTFNVTQISNTPSVVGDPSSFEWGNTPYVYVQATGGDLVELYNNGPGQNWLSLDLSTTAGGTKIGGDPAGLLYGGNSLHVYAGGPPPATPPQGVGLYGLVAGAPTSQAIEDDWPIIGDTGALGTQSAPYTGFLLNADLPTGLDIQASGRRVTWLSFWTVSGPVASGPSNTPCWTPSCFYSDAYGAGQFVAHTIDGYASQGLSLKPDYVILDPEGYPDNHSGLDSGPGATAPNWTAFLTGWADGIASIDTSLHAGFYADQSEYNSFDLASIQLPAFVAVAFPGPVDILHASSNVAGFIAFGATCPATSEEQLLTGAPWNGAYNTLQFAGTYCGP